MSRLKAPIAEQKKAGLVVGVDYPSRIVEHEVASKENMSKMAAAYALHKEAAAKEKSSAPPKKKQKT